MTAENINGLIGASGLRGEIDLMSIDIDFNDYWVWKAIEIVDPRVVVIEYNAGLHPPLSLTVPYQPNRSGGGTNFFGASLEALVRLGAVKGYRIVGCNISGSNAFFVRRESVRGPFCGARYRRGTLRAAAPFLFAVVRRAARAAARPVCPV